MLIVELRKMDSGYSLVGICEGKSKPKMFFVLRMMKNSKKGL
jgi:hypothetical protein